MRSIRAILMIIALTLCSCAQSARSISSFSGERAMEHVRAQVAFGPRPPGSPELQQCREYIISQMKSFGYEIEEDAFIAETPYGPIRMVNLIAYKKTTDKNFIAFATHYDTKLMKGKNFVGANDAGSSTGVVIELARVLAERDDQFAYRFLFLDGEEAFVEWSAFDSTYGSRHLAKKWKAEGVVPKVRALLLLDMIGDKDLELWYETHSTKTLMDMVWSTAEQTGMGSILSRFRGAIEDDHLPFLDVGIPSVDIIDLNYGPDNAFHHTDDDTLDKISVESMEKVGRLVLSMLPQLK